MSIGHKIKYLRENANLTQAELAKIAGVTDKAVSTWENDIYQPRMGAIQKIADYFGVPKSFIVDDDKEPAAGEKKPHPLPRSHEGVRIPVYGSIPCGVPIEAIDDITDWEEIPKEWCAGNKEFFALVTKGDSMYPKYIEGDVVIVQKQEDFMSGDDCVVYVNSDYEATLKTLYKLKEGIQVKPFNPSYTPRTYSWKEVEALPISIAGVVVELRRKVK